MWIIDRTGGQITFFLICGMTPSVDLAGGGVSHAKDLGPVVQN